MPVSAARRRTNDAYNAKCDYISLRPLKPDGAAIRAAAAASTCEADVVLFHTPGVTLFPRILCAANDHRVGIAPEKQHALGGGHLAEDALFHRKIKPRIVRVREQQA